MSLIIAQPKELIAAFVNVRQRVRRDASWGNFTALGLVKNDELVAGVIYNCYEGANVNMHIGAVDGARWLTPAFLHAAFEYPFGQLAKRRATAFIASSNRQARRFVEHLGFTLEGTLPHYYVDDDAVIYGLLRENCRFLLRKAA